MSILVYRFVVAEKKQVMLDRSVQKRKTEHAPLVL